MKTLSIITRVHPQRRKFLSNCIDSVKKQVPADYEHILVRDLSDSGSGMLKANQLLQSAKNVNGRYIMVLDDDDMLIYDNLVHDINKLAKNNYQIIFFKGKVNGLGVLPPTNLWGKKPIRGKIASFCFATRRDIWLKHIYEWGAVQRAGDFKFLNKIYQGNQVVYWHDRIVARTQRVSRGKA